MYHFSEDDLYNPDDDSNEEYVYSFEENKKSSYINNNQRYSRKKMKIKKYGKYFDNGRKHIRHTMQRINSN
jgi:hypothetical protein